MFPVAGGVECPAVSGQAGSSAWIYDAAAVRQRRGLKWLIDVERRASLEEKRSPPRRYQWRSAEVLVVVGDQ